MPGFVRERSPHAALSQFAPFDVERRRDHDCFDALLGEFGKSQYSVRQVLILRHDAKTLLDKAIDTYSLRRIGIKTLFAQLIGTNSVDLAGFKMRPLGERTRLGAKGFHFFCFACLSPFFWLARSS